MKIKSVFKKICSFNCKNEPKGLHHDNPLCSQFFKKILEIFQNPVSQQTPLSIPLTITNRYNIGYKFISYWHA
jgi:hypothetical protein